MTFFSHLPLAAAVFALLLTIAGLLRRKSSFASWCFVAGMALFSIDSFLTGQTQHATQLDGMVRGLTLVLIVKSFVPAAWLGFSLTYSRGDYLGSLAHWKISLILFALLPICLALGFQAQLIEAVLPTEDGEQLQLRFTGIGTALNVILLVSHVWILMNLEQTFRSAVGTMRWRIKYVVLGLAVIFGSRIYVRSHAVLYSMWDLDWAAFESSGLLIGCLLLAVAYVRTGIAEIDVHPSRAVLRTSVTVLLAGGYLFIVGVFARIAKHFGGEENLQIQNFVVLVGTVLLAVLLLSDRLRQGLYRFLDSHFVRAQYDSVRIWSEFSRRMARVKTTAGLCDVSVKLVSETFQVLSVTIWLLNEHTQQLINAASTAPRPVDPTSGNSLPAASKAVAAGLRTKFSPFDIEGVNERWAEELRQLSPSTFANGGNRWCVPLRSGEQILGALLLADRVNGAPYTGEQIHLLRCIADDLTSVLLNLRMADELARSRELEGLRLMSAFFVHDLKNAATSLNLLLKNLPVHYDNPEFRVDALRAVSNVARRIDEIIGGLSALREGPQLKTEKLDFNALVSQVLDGLDAMPQVELTSELQPLPRILGDGEQIRSVVTNLVLNARDSLSPEGRIHVRTERAGSDVVLTVADNGCGMSEAFLRDSLFRPFQSTKKNGLGIGMFQCRMIVEAHGGSIRAESEVGRGSTFFVSLPVKDVE